MHTDHLGAPRKVTDPLNSNALLWRWDPDTYGSAAPTGTLTYNLRFPGQYYVSESGLHSNYYRTYDPQMGRYLEADPMGLKGGINPYAYAGGDPVNLIDPLGLLTLYAGTTGAAAFGPWGVTGGEGSYVSSGGQGGFYNFNGNAQGGILDAGYNLGFQTGGPCDSKDKSKYKTLDVVFFSIGYVSNATSWGLNFGAGIVLGLGWGESNTQIHPR